LVPAFSLLELLVVIAIIAVLMAILIPNLSNARATARRTVCASNLHQLGLATNLYLDYNAGYFWPYHAKPTTAPPGYPWWFGFEANGPGAPGVTNRPLDKSLSPLAPYTANLANSLQCPDFPYTDPAYFPKFNQHAASYGYNITLGPADPSPTKNRSQYADRASSVFVFADGVQFDGLAGPTFNEAAYIQHATGFSGYAHFRHTISGSPQTQIVYIDGHVDSQPYSPPGFAPVANMPTGNLSAPEGWQSIYGN
jgi:prepilin-type N-terminal cleavage/methylation domain-containing protein